MTARTLDRESAAEYTVTLLCHDLGRPPLSTSLQLSVTVTDINDNPPVFHRHDDAPQSRDSSPAVSYVAEIFENNFIGAFVTQVNVNWLAAWRSG